VKKLSPKQQAFVDAYAGNGTEAARIAGYKGNENTLCSMGKENLRKPHVWAAIQARNAGKKASTIATREERQQFWTSFVRDEELDPSARLRASELLGKSQCDFIEKKEIMGKDGAPLSIVAALLDEIDGATRGIDNND